MDRTNRMTVIACVALAAIALSGCGGESGASVASEGSRPEVSVPSATMASSASASGPASPSGASISTSPSPSVAVASPSPSPTPSPTVLGGAAAGADLKVDQVVDWMRFEIIKCGGPIGTWAITVSGTKDIGSGVTLVLSGDGSVTLTGTPTTASGPFAADYVIDVEGIPLSTGGQIAQVSGTGRYADGVLHLEGRSSGTSHGENPYYAVILSMMASTERFTLTPTAGTYC